jgi:hypothetical protein
MEPGLNSIMHRRIYRHALFWLVWILGFTFIKSFGQNAVTYFGWLIYYLITLPIFMLHTYLIVYLAIPHLLKRWKWLLFVLVFIVLLYLSSLAEIWITNHILYGWFPAVFNEQIDPRVISEVVISGVGNLYILLAFIAVRQVRIWYLADEAQSKLEKRKIELIKAETKAGMQPNMLLYLIEEIEKLAKKKAEETSLAIAQLSELLNQLMQTNELGEIGFDEELQNVKRLIRIYETIRGDSFPGTFTVGEGALSQLIPAFILFTPIEIVFRTAETWPSGNLVVRVPNNDEVYIRIGISGRENALSSRLRSEMEELFPGKYEIDISRDEQLFQIQIKATG